VKKAASSSVIAVRASKPADSSALSLLYVFLSYILVMQKTQKQASGIFSIGLT
jgi:hypothetical protein